MTYYLRNDGLIPKEFQDLGLRYIKDNEDISIYEPYNPNIHGKTAKIIIHIGKTSPKFVYCGGLIFKSITSCAKFYDIHKEMIRLWLIGKYPTRTDFVELGLRFATEEDMSTYPIYN